jgi:hypothetical protein
MGVACRRSEVVVTGDVRRLGRPAGTMSELLSSIRRAANLGPMAKSSPPDGCVRRKPSIVERP